LLVDEVSCSNRRAAPSARSRRFKPSSSTGTCLPLQVALLSIDKLRRPHCRQRSPRLWGRPWTRAGAACRAARGAV